MLSASSGPVPCSFAKPWSSLLDHQTTRHSPLSFVLCPMELDLFRVLTSTRYICGPGWHQRSPPIIRTRRVLFAVRTEAAARNLADGYAAATPLPPPSAPAERDASLVPAPLAALSAHALCILRAAVLSVWAHPSIAHTRGIDHCAANHGGGQVLVLDLPGGEIMLILGSCEKRTNLATV